MCAMTMEQSEEMSMKVSVDYSRPWLPANFKQTSLCEMARKLIEILIADFEFSDGLSPEDEPDKEVEEVIVKLVMFLLFAPYVNEMRDPNFVEFDVMMKLHQIKVTMMNRMHKVENDNDMMPQWRGFANPYSEAELEALANTKDLTTLEYRDLNYLADFCIRRALHNADEMMEGDNCFVNFWLNSYTLSWHEDDYSEYDCPNVMLLVQIMNVVKTHHYEHDCTYYEPGTKPPQVEEAEEVEEKEQEAVAAEVDSDSSDDDEVVFVSNAAQEEAKEEPATEKPKKKEPITKNSEVVKSATSATSTVAKETKPRNKRDPNAPKRAYKRREKNSEDANKSKDADNANTITVLKTKKVKSLKATNQLVSALSSSSVSLVPSESSSSADVSTCANASPRATTRTRIQLYMCSAVGQVMDINPVDVFLPNFTMFSQFNPLYMEVFIQTSGDNKKTLIFKTNCISMEIPIQELNKYTNQIILSSGAILSAPGFPPIFAKTWCG